MSKIDNGGPAFPTKPRERTIGGEVLYHSGMTLRDWFAGQALANAYTHHDQAPDKVAEWAYQVADAMLYVKDL